MKAGIIEQLGEVELLKPLRIAEGLGANERAKVRMSALQAIARQAAGAEYKPEDLSAECAAAGINASEVSSIVAAAHAEAPNTIASPGLGKLVNALFSDVDAMIDAVETGDTDAATSAVKRMSILRPNVRVEGDAIDVSSIAGVSALRDDRDSVHRLVMDLHKALNRMAAACAEENIAGAHAHGVLASDRPAIEAFMRGLERTRSLKFDHPGLDTTVTRAGTRLLIQNDIGETDAHVVVIAIEGLKVTITHTDIHRARARFFVGLFDRFAVEWTGLDRESARGLAGNDSFYLVTGRYTAGTDQDRDALLEAIGMSLVFLIDWNKARKSLRTLVDGASTTRLLEWAARQQIGHRAYLECGGAELVAAAVRRSAAGRIGFGDDLAKILGRDIAMDFLKAVLRIATESLREGRSVRLVRDAIEADLVRHLDRADSAIMAVVLRQMGLARDIAVAIADHVAKRSAAVSEDAKEQARLAERARHIEEKADRIAVDARASLRALKASTIVAQLVDTAEDTIDELEQAAYLASLMPAVIDRTLIDLLSKLADAAISGTEAAASGIDAAAEVPQGQRADINDAFEATRRLIDFEHAADDAERAVTGLVLRNGCADGALCVLELARSIERATDRLGRIGHLLHEHVMADLS